jgi:hypothetical protein
MENNDIRIDSDELAALCSAVRILISRKQFRESEELIRQAMGKYPHAAQPHNLFGIQLENEGDHLAAMKHFRAAVALDATYLPARYNMDQYADVFGKEHMDVYVEADYPQEQKKDLYKIEYDENGIGRMVKREKAGIFAGKK